MLRWCLARERPSRLEVLGFAAIVSVLTLALLWDHLHRAGWYADDYFYRQYWTGFDGRSLWGHVQAMTRLDLLKGRPGLAAYMSFTQAVLGDRPRVHLAWAAVLAVPFSTSLYLLLRVLRFRPLEAGVIGLLLLVFPGSDSTRIWAIISDAQLAMSLVLLGVTFSVVSMSAEGRRRVVLRVAGVLLTAAGVLIYEITWAPLALAFLLYRTRVPWRVALRQGLVDWVVLALIYLLVLRHGFFQPQSFDTSKDHAWEIFKQSLTFFAQHVLPFGSTAVALVLVGAVLAASALTAWRLPAGHPTRAVLLRWLTVAGGSTLVTAAAYAMYTTASPLYVPLAPGYMNRTNAFAAVPLIVVAFATVALLTALASLALRAVPSLPVRRDPTIAAAGAAVLAALVFGIDYTKGITHDLKLWDSAYARAHHELYAFKTQVPSFASRPFVVFYGQPLEELPGIPVWEFNYDLNGAMQLMYGDDRSIRARPAFPGAKITCNKQDIGWEGIYARPGDGGPYGHVYFYDAVRDRVLIPRNRRQCRAANRQLVPGPWTARDPGGWAR
jgi:hypothetical protein